MTRNRIFALIWLLLTVAPMYVAVISISWFDEVAPLGNLSVFGASIIAMQVVVLTYVIYVWVSQLVPKDKRWLWSVVLLLGQVYVAPFFWYWYVWDPKSEHKSWVGIVSIIFLVAMTAPIGGLSRDLQDHKRFAWFFNKYQTTDVDLDVGFQAVESVGFSSQKSEEQVMLHLVLRDFEVGFEKDAVLIRPSGFKRVVYDDFRIPKEAIHSCSRQCGAGSEYILILEEDSIQIDLEGEQRLVGWCWNNNKPMLTSKERRGWLYNREKLKDTAMILNNQPDESVFLDVGVRACQGY